MLRQSRTVTEIRYLLIASEVREALMEWATNHRASNTEHYAILTDEAELEFVDGNAVFIMRYDESNAGK